MLSITFSCLNYKTQHISQWSTSVILQNWRLQCKNPTQQRAVQPPSLVSFAQACFVSSFVVHGGESIGGWWNIDCKMMWEQCCHCHKERWSMIIPHGLPQILHNNQPQNTSQMNGIIFYHSGLPANTTSAQCMKHFNYQFMSIKYL